MNLLEVTVTQQGDWVVLAASGELDISSAAVLERELARAEGRRPPGLVLDLSALTFMDSTGLRLLLAADTRARDESRRLAVVPGPPQVHRVFEIAGVTTRIQFVEDPGKDGSPAR